jgi:hypothetical protein
MRIMFTERYYEPYTDEEIEASEDLGMPLPKRKAQYRRVYVPLHSIFAPKELQSTEKFTLIEFNDESTMIVKGGFEEVCQQIDDREAQYMGDLEIEEGYGEEGHQE